MGVNTKYKDSVFSFLFSDPDILRELYSAIEGIPMPQDAKIDINTLSDMLFLEQINDLSFTIDDRLIVLIEHQSTINLNMPLRLLMYIAHVYEKIIERKKLYQKKLEKIPAPEFIVLYNGKEDYPDRSELKLSSAFKDKRTALELTVQVYNINCGHNPDMLKKCETLDGYSIFVEKVREYEKALTFEEAMQRAIKYCIEHNILKQFFEKHGSEVYNMSLWGLDIEEAREAWYEEAREEGLAAGMAQGIEQGMAQGIEQGMAQGIEQGMAQGVEQGMAQGVEQGIEQGMAQGIEQGMAQGAIEVARKMKAADRPLREIAEFTGLSPDAIEKLS